jgi:hypothetical protein
MSARDQVQIIRTWTNASYSRARFNTKRILIVNTFFDDLRINGPNPNKVPQAMGPVYLAGAFSRECCEVRVYNEHYSGPLEDECLLGWPDMLVLTGLTVAFDRMLHLTAYARTRNPNVIVVAGGPAVRALPCYSQGFFDYACLGDIEQIRDIIVDALGARYLSEKMIPRYDLMKHFTWLGYLESSRNCNFKCTFCSLTGEKNEYQRYSLDSIRQQVYAMGKRRHVVLIDNNFYGNDRNFFLARLELLKELREQGYFRGWSALVSSDFFAKDENLILARDAGCESLFSGFESFDSDLLCQYNKRQNTVLPQIEIIKKCLEAGIVFTYGIMLDVSRRHIADIRSEIEFIFNNPEITLPSYFSLTIPLLGTPYFEECVKRELLLPNLRLRDLDGFTITSAPLDSIEEAVSLVRDLPNLRCYRRKIFRKGLGFVRRNRKHFGPLQIAIMMTNMLLLCMPTLNNHPAGLQFRLPRRTYIGGKDLLDHIYTPAFNVDLRYQNHFVPTMVTDLAGQLTEHLAEERALTSSPELMMNERV